eukprot:8449621-Pyramimonas_sp.AAC.1
MGARSAPMPQSWQQVLGAAPPAEGLERLPKAQMSRRAGAARSPSESRSRSPPRRCSPFRQCGHGVQEIVRGLAVPESLPQAAAMEDSGQRSMQGGTAHHWSQPHSDIESLAQAR